MLSDTVSILNGNEFLVSDCRGDLKASPTVAHGLFLDDTRFLSAWVLIINGQQPMLLSVDDLSYFSVQHFLALSSHATYIDSHLSVLRQRSIGGGFHEDLFLENHDRKPIDLEVRIAAAADFADLFEVKDKVIAKKGELYTEVDAAGQLTLGYKRASFTRETRVTSSQPARFDERGLLFQVRLEPQSRWTTCLEVLALRERARRDRAPMKFTHVPGATRHRPRSECRRVVEQGTDGACVVATAGAHPQAQSHRPGGTALQQTHHSRALPAAGLPWFMTVFGRDSLLTSFQALPFVPELAATTLRALALLQARRDDPFRDAEPGKILHELRFGELTAFEEAPHSLTTDRPTPLHCF